ncbi:MAG: dipeptidase [SAR202 cluster bacterium]|jgi:membrane dipeptidase|nr:dipeptidase [SAR202 cluster bacterium]
MPLQDARKLYDESLVIDGLNVSNWDSPAVYDSLSLGGVTAINATIATWEGFAETLDNISAWSLRFKERSDSITLVETVDDILEAKRNGRTGIILGWQNATPIENDLDRLGLFHRLGVRIVQVTYHERNLLGNGCYERRDDGLSHFGADTVAEMNRLGILVDLSHVGEKTTLDAIETSRKPVAFTHANARSYHDVVRNKTDEALRALADRGGVVGVTCIVTFLRTGYESTVDDYAEAIDDMVGRVGIDHVGIGTDYTQDQPESFWRYIGSQQGTKYPSTFDDGTARYQDRQLYPQGLEMPDKLPNLTDALVRRGRGSAEIEKILGGNWLRLLRDVWV